MISRACGNKELWLTMSICPNIKPYPANIFVQKVSSAYNICCIYLNAFWATFIMAENTMSPDQTVSM